jgi:enoyl-CoA hydratase/carnithine racemase
VDRTFRTVRVETREHVRTITLHRPERKNAIGPEMANELIWALDDARDDPQVRVIVLAGAGTAFCAGGDLGGMSEGAPESRLDARGDFSDLLLRFPTLGKPTVARVHGPAMGGGVGLVASCTFAVGAESATLGTPEIKRGLFPFMILAPLARVVPRRKLLELLLLGEKLTAREALAVGLLSHVVPDAELDVAVSDLAARLAAQSPTAMRMGLLAFHAHAEQDMATALPRLRDELYAILGTEDAREGLAAFLQKRQPRWTGR